jgi:hypothetical protein
MQGPNTVHPIAGYNKFIYAKPTITNPNIIVVSFISLIQNLKVVLLIITNGLATN